MMTTNSERIGTDARILHRRCYPCIHIAKYLLKTFRISHATPVERTEVAFMRLMEGLNELKR